MSSPVYHIKRAGDEIAENHHAMMLSGLITPTGWDGNDQPGWLYCDGRAVSRTTYAALFQAIGTTFGVGDGSTTFNLPDLRNIAQREITADQSIVNQTEIDLALGTHFRYDISGWMRPTVDASLYLNFGTGGTPDTSAGSHAWHAWRRQTAQNFGSTSDIAIKLGATVAVESDAADGGVQFRLTVMEPSQTSIRKRVVGEVAFGAISTFEGFDSDGTYLATTGAVDVMRFSFSSGNIAEGRVIVEATPYSPGLKYYIKT